MTNKKEDSPINMVKENTNRKEQSISFSQKFKRMYETVKDVTIRTWRVIGALSIGFCAVLVVRASGGDVVYIILATPAIVWAATSLLKR